MSLEKYNKQPWERKDYDTTFQDWLNGGDILDGVTASVVCLTDPNDSSLQVDKVEFTADRVKLWISGGTDGQRYKVTARVTTEYGRQDEYELVFKIKDE
ncbi:hypothetical protein [Comamonas sp.]|uniref:phage fiber-tail adaptor protein n=1 Tax=Comamonas sp. TaxID=34028 RepID=UPI0028B1A502|nr:hypothetical protein [Comamonas sp.]